MKARAPGKIVLAGAYAVLERAPALVSAVDRYVIADTSRKATFEAPEAREAIPHGDLPFIDVSALRTSSGGLDRKLGLGSSAAIVVASLFAKERDANPELSDEYLASQMLRPAIYAHRRAQDGGSGIDVVASVEGGTRVCVVGDMTRGEVGGMDGGLPVVSRRHSLPHGLTVHVYAGRESCLTSAMVGEVRRLRARSIREYVGVIEPLRDAAAAMVAATTVLSFVEAAHEQLVCLDRLGHAAGIPIVPGWILQLSQKSKPNNVAVYPAGAGGSEIVLCVGTEYDCKSVEKNLNTAGLELLDIGIGAPGVSTVLDEAVEV